MLTYKKSGVDISKANRFVQDIKAMAKTTTTARVLNRPQSFGALFSLDLKGYKKPVLVSSTDGVGTKLLVANLVGKHDTVGIDLVAMNANDVLCTGTRPLFFLDYLATGKLNPQTMKQVFKGIVEGCQLAGCALIGGETAEMPGMYKGEDYDLAGFVVGIVEESKLIDGSHIKAGDYVVGLSSSGLHSNGYALARKALSLKEQKQYARDLLRPTRIYVKPILALLDHVGAGSESTRTIKGMAHMTGGAWYEKLTKILPRGLAFTIQKGSWPVPEIFKLIQKKGRVPEADMYRTFNMGIGFTMVVSPKDVMTAQVLLRRYGQESFVIGKVTEDSKRKIIFK